MARNIQIIGSAFGPCDTDKTFSGVARHLFGVLKEKHVMVGYVNTKNLRFIDVLHGMIDFSKIRKYGHPGVSKAWLWKWDTVNRLSDRFNRCLDSMPDHNVVLQVGTHVHVQQANVKHYCFTDMTVAQAIYSPLAEGFNMTKLTTKQAVEAINVQKSIFQNCEAIFVDSNWVKNSIVADYGIARDRVHVVFVGPGLELCPRKNKKTKHKILFLGQDWERKGGQMLLDSFRIVKKRIPDITLTIIGCSPKVRDDSIKVLGFLDKTVESEKAILQEEMAGSTILCVPSLFEPFGICFVEAQLRGVPPVTFEGEGRGDAIIDGVTGLLIKERSVEALCEALLELLLNTDKRQQMARAGKKFVEENLTWEIIASRILEIIGNYQS